MVVVVCVVVVSVVLVVITVDIVVVGYKNINLKFGQNQVRNSWDIFDVVVVLIVVFAIIFVVDPKNLSFKFGQNCVSSSWDIANIEFLVMGGCCVKSFSCQTKLRLSWVWISSLQPHFT